jgi:hypothetical protein
MAVSSVNLIIDKGTDFEATFNVFEPSSEVATFSNFVGTCKIRKYPSSPTSISCQVIITAATGEIKIRMTKQNTLLLSNGRNYYDVILTSTIDSSTFKVVEGTIIVNDTVSK